MKNSFEISRRKFISDAGLTVLSLPVLSAFSFCNNPSEIQKDEHIMNEKKSGKLGIALVGLGNYSTGQLAPALQETEHCFLSGIVTGTPEKAENWKKQYNLPEKNIYNYDTFDQVKDNPDIDIIYVVLPNSMHAEYVIRAAEAGKHVICEKPMALTVADCDKMIEACNKAGKMLSIGYRLHFEPYHLEMARLGQNKVYGDIQNMAAGFGFSIGDPTQWRLKKNMSGGGPLQDLGIYCIQGFCYTTGMEPIAVTAQEGAKANPEKFKEVEQSLTWQFEMPGGAICEGKASYADSLNYLHAEAEKGAFELRPAFNYNGQKGITPNGLMNFPQVNQQARQMDAIAMSIQKDEKSIVPGEMGRRDVKLIQSIYEAMRTGKRVIIDS